MLDGLEKHTYSSVVTGAEALALVDIMAADKISELLYVAVDEFSAEKLASGLRLFAPDVEIVIFPAWDCIPYDRVSPSVSVVSRRIKALSNIVKKTAKKRVVIVTANAAVQKIIPQDVIEESSLVARIGDEIKRDYLASFLIKNGYVNSGSASEPGEFALRGSIVDIVPSGSDDGYRLDFFGDELESIRLFDPLSQVTKLGDNKVMEVAIIPASEIINAEETISIFRSKYRELFGAVIGDDPLYEAVSDGHKYAGEEHWLPLFYDGLSTIFDYCCDAKIVFAHLAEDAIISRWELIKDSYETRLEMSKAKGISDVKYNSIPPEMLYIGENRWENLMSGRRIVALHQFSMPDGNEVTETKFRKSTNYFAESQKAQETVFSMLKKDMENAASNRVKTFVACMSEGSRSRLEIMLKEYEIPFISINEIADSKGLLRKNGKLGLVVLNIDSGFQNDDMLLVTEQDLLGERILRKSAASKKRRSEKFLAEASNLMEGELIVHREHGIGRYEGLETLDVQGDARDFILLIYEGGDKLYVPVENIDLVKKYGGDAENAHLDKLGGLSWQKRTALIKKRIKIAAAELVETAAARELRTAEPFVVESGGYEEFCARFPYSETDDQLSSIEDVLEDLASGQPMDRLVCGDVGFGKTEVALRAAFVVASGEATPHPNPLPQGERGYDSPQVAIIAPTTLLCNQHYHGFKRRFKDMGLEVRQLSRLVSSKQAKETKQLLEEGKVDIVVGTHALLAKDIKFRKLSLLIVDEEQRFGVAQKERLKKLRADTHILTLTATPIPRTLQLSLSGIRELSLITTPPVDRLAIRTYVMPFDSVVIREAILREKYRGGRTFYVCPRVKDVEEMEGKLKKLIPEVKIVTAHGRMPADQLDKIMKDFYDGAFDVLLATTIVESGLDIPSANTMIVHRAEMYGLAQLYQIRGRVGRSKVRAYAYLTLPPKKIPTKQAMKRLEVMQKLDTLGAGFSLASHDMDIRGFGNLLGDEQSGNVKEVGVELYQDMLREAIESIKARKGEEVDANEDEAFSVRINIGMSVLIPESYIADLDLRMSMYRKIAGLVTAEEVEEMAVELVDRFGAIPKEVENLLQIVKCKQICRKSSIEKFDAGPKGAVITFHNNKFNNPEKLIGFIAENPSSMKIRPDNKLAIINQNWTDDEVRVKESRAIITKIGELLG